VFTFSLDYTQGKVKAKLLRYGKGRLLGALLCICVGLSFWNIGDILYGVNLVLIGSRLMQQAEVGSHAFKKSIYHLNRQVTKVQFPGR